MQPRRTRRQRLEATAHDRRLPTAGADADEAGPGADHGGRFALTPARERDGLAAGEKNFSTSSRGTFGGIFDAVVHAWAPTKAAKKLMSVGGQGKWPFRRPAMATLQRTSRTYS